MAVAPGILRSAMDLLQRGLPAQAEAVLRRALQRDPADAPANHLLGLVLSRLGQVPQAEYFLRAALKARPDEPAYLNALGNLMNTAGRSAEAAEAFGRAVAANAAYFPGWVGLSAALCGCDRFDDAAAAAARSVEVDPSRYEGHDNLAISLAEGGRVDEAIVALRTAFEHVPRSAQLLRNVVTCLLARQEENADQTLALARRLGEAITAGTPSDPGAPGARSKTGPLKIAYLSPDLHTHSVAYFLEPILEHHDRGRFEVLCYHAGNRNDETTARLKSYRVTWRVVTGLDDAALARRARADGIDIIVDLAGHTLGSRVSALAHGCAPVQATYLGYAATTGIPQVHYRIVDSDTDPPGAERWCTERLVRIEGCFLCYRAPADAPAVKQRPPDAPVTFGSFNMIQKMSPRVIEMWAAVLRAVPGSNLLLKNRGLGDGKVAQRTREQFAALGVDPVRLRLMGQTPLPKDHLALYGQIDIALDTFPYNGTATTCEALYMGVPVVALAGKTHAGRVGVSLLKAAGLPKLVAESTEEYVGLARDLAMDPKRRRILRSSLRSTMGASALMDGPGFARRFEKALVVMWERAALSAQGSGPVRESGPA